MLTHISRHMVSLVQNKLNISFKGGNETIIPVDMDILFITHHLKFTECMKTDRPNVHGIDSHHVI